MTDFKKRTDSDWQQLSDEELGDELAYAYRCFKEMMRRGYIIDIQIKSPNQETQAMRFTPKAEN